MGDLSNRMTMFDFGTNQLYLGSFEGVKRAANNQEATPIQFTHLISIGTPPPGLPYDVVQLTIEHVIDDPEQNLIPYLISTDKFIREAMISGKCSTVYNVVVVLVVMRYCVCGSVCVYDI